MKAYDLMELAGRNLREAVLRNSLTTLGIGVGVASLVAMLSLGIGLQRLVSGQLGRTGLFDSIFVASRQDMRTDRRQDVKPDEIKPLDDDARKRFQQISGVVEVYPDVRGMGEFRFASPGQKEESYFTLMAGLPLSARRSDVFDDLQGNFFSGANAPEAIILNDFGRQLLGITPERGHFDDPLTNDQAKQLLGKEITLRYAERQTTGDQPASQDASDASAFSVVRKEQKLKIVGIVNAEPYGGGRGARARVLVPMDFAESLNMIQPADLRSLMRSGQGKTYMVLVVRVARSTQVLGVEDAIKKQGYSTFSLLDASQNISQLFAFLDLFLGIFGSLALAVASLGIVNTLVMAILERRREIGIMKAIGASDGDVQKIFFCEAGSMGMLGGVLGIFMGWVIGRVINFGTNIYLQRRDIKPGVFFHVPWWLVAAALGFSIVVSLLAGLYPAARAARLDPVKALRHE